MALINCPECNKQVSDKAHSCPNCGYPFDKYIDTTSNTSCNIIIVSFQGKSRIELVKYLMDMHKLGLSDAKELTDNLPQTVFKNVSSENAEKVKKSLLGFGCIVKIENTFLAVGNDDDKISNYYNGKDEVCCPRCGSTAITTGQKGFSLFTGFIGSNKTVNRCAKCGYSWEP